MSSRFDRLPLTQRILINDLIINGFRDDPAQASRYAQAMRQAPGRESASDRFDQMIAEQREVMAGQVQSGGLRLPRFASTPFANNNISDGEELNRGRGTLRTIREQMSITSRGPLDMSFDQMRSLVAQAKSGMGYEPNGISPVAGRAAPAAPAGLGAQAQSACQEIAREMQAAFVGGDLEGANALQISANRQNCPTTRRGNEPTR